MENPFKKAIENEGENSDGVNVEEATPETEAAETPKEENIKEKEPEIKEEKNEWQEKYETLNNQYIRLAADFDNFRKRQEAEKESLLKYGAENTVKKLIEVIDNYFAMYGYATKLLKIPNTNNRSNWNYVKTIGCYILADIPQEDLQEIKNMFDNGLTIWHNPSTFRDYSQSNAIVS